MTRTKLAVVMALAVGIVAGAAVTEVLHAQGDGVKRMMLQKKDLTGIESREVVMAAAEIAPGIAAGKHLHHGTEVGYVVEGSAVLEVEGEAPRMLKAGDSYHVDLRKPHDAKNTGTTPLKVVAVYIVEKGKPLAEPVK